MTVRPVGRTARGRRWGRRFSRRRSSHGDPLPDVEFLRNRWWPTAGAQGSGWVCPADGTGRTAGVLLRGDVV